MLESCTFPAATYSSVVKDNHLEDKQRLPVFSLAGVHTRSCSSTANFERDLHYSKNADTYAKLEKSEEYRLSTVIPVPVSRVATVNVNGAKLLPVQKSQVSAELPVCTYIYVYVLHWAQLNKIEKVVIMPSECPCHERSQNVEQYRLVRKKSCNGSEGEARQVRTLAASWLLESPCSWHARLRYWQLRIC